MTTAPRGAVSGAMVSGWPRSIGSGGLQRDRAQPGRLEYSRNLVFGRGTVLDEVYQGRLDRPRRVLDVATLKTSLGRTHTVPISPASPGTRTLGSSGC